MYGEFEYVRFLLLDVVIGVEYEVLEWDCDFEIVGFVVMVCEVLDGIGLYEVWDFVEVDMV